MWTWFNTHRTLGIGGALLILAAIATGAYFLWFYEATPSPLPGPTTSDRLSAIETKLTSIETALVDPATGLPATKKAADDTLAALVDPATGLPAILKSSDNTFNVVRAALTTTDPTDPTKLVAVDVAGEFAITRTAITTDGDATRKVVADTSMVVATGLDRVHADVHQIQTVQLAADTRSIPLTKACPKGRTCVDLDENHDGTPEGRYMVVRAGAGFDAKKWDGRFAEVVTRVRAIERATGASLDDKTPAPAPAPAPAGGGGAHIDMRVKPVR